MGLFFKKIREDEASIIWISYGGRLLATLIIWSIITFLISRIVTDAFSIWIVSVFVCSLVITIDGLPFLRDRLRIWAGKHVIDRKVKFLTYETRIEK